jgi:hypothetical protein
MVDEGAAAKLGSVMQRLQAKVELAMALEHFGSTVVFRGPRGKSVRTWQIVAIATREDFKWRDAYDLWWITRCALQEGELLTDEERLRALRVTAAIYDKTLLDVGAGLSRVVASGILNEQGAFENDMKRWFPHDVFARYSAAGQFRDALQVASREITRAQSLIDGATQEVL